MTVDKLSALDECFLRLETPEAHMHEGWTVILEGEPPTLAALRRQVAARLEEVPRFRRRAVCSRLRLHDPLWADDESFDVSHHVLAVPAPAGSNMAELRALAGELLSSPLDRARPLWRLHLITGLRGGRFAIVGQIHHALVDGLGAVALATLLLDRGSATTDVLPRRFEPEPSPGLLDRVVASASERVRLAWSAGELALRGALNPGVVGEAIFAVKRLGGALAGLGSRAPATSLNRRIGSCRAVAFTRLPLAAAQDIARQRGVSADDVVLATSSLALGRYLRRADESHPWLRVLVPVNTRTDSADELGNQLSGVLFELPVGERDPLLVLDEVARQRRQHERAAHAEPLDAVVRASRLAPVQVRDVTAWLLTRPQAFNTAVMNIPGPPEHRYLLGRRVQAAYPAVPLVQGHGLSIGVLAYAAGLHVGLYADPEVVPDLVAVARDFARAFDELRMAIDPRSPRPRRGGTALRRSRRRVATPA
jgi:WS/DGAT/MGAT family acyltransferase